MRKEARQKAILELLNTTEPVQNRTLIDHFRVTDMTIRRDLNELATQGKLIRTFGGAMLVGSDTERPSSAPETAATPGSASVFPSPSTSERVPEAAYLSRVLENASLKRAIAKTCLSMVAGKLYIYLDSGSTTFSIAQLVTPEMPCTFLTNGINIAAELMRRECPSVISIGGEIHLNTWSTRGTFAENQIHALHADVAFLGCNSISPEGNVMIGNMTETGVKQAIMEVSDEIYLVADSSKFDTYSLTAYANVRDFSGIITDSQIPPEIRRKLETLGTRIIVAG